MKKESARSLRLTSEAITALKTLGADNPDCSQGDLVSQALIEKANKAPLAPVIRLGVLHHKHVASLQCEAALAERRLREMSQKISRIRPQEKGQAERLSAFLEQAEVDLEAGRKLRLGIANLARLGNQLTSEDYGRAMALRKWVQQRIDKAPDDKTKTIYELELQILKAFLLE